MTRANFNTNLHKLALSEDVYRSGSTRPELYLIYFKDDHAYVSDAHIAIKQHLKYHEVENYQALNGKAIHKNVFKIIKKKYYKVIAKKDYLLCYDRNGNKATFDYSPIEKDMAAGIERCLPDDNKVTVDQIGFNPGLIKNLWKGMVISETNQLRFEFYGKNKAIVVKSNCIPDQIGLLMPVMIMD